MKISTKGRYSLIFLIDLAQHQNEGLVTLNDVAIRKSISKKYLEQIVPVLNKSGLIKANRGSKGGYSLAKANKDINVLEVLQATENTFMPDNSPVEDSEEVLNLFIWQGLDNTINNYLKNISLQDIIDKQQSYYSNNYII